MAWSQVEVLSTWLSVDPPLDIIPMLTNVSLEALSGFANIFVMGIVRTVWFNTFPVVDTIFTLTVKVILDWGCSGGPHRPGCWFGRESSSTE